jgi:hypothetical protein
VVGFRRRRASAQLLRASGWAKEDRAALQGSSVSEDCALLQRSWRETRDPFRAHSVEIVVAPGR